MKITNEVLEAHLNCRFKGHLKLAGEVGTRSDYETMTTAARAASREQAIAKLVARSGGGAARRGTAVTVATLRSGPPLLADAALEDEGLSLRFDALKRAPGPSRLGDHHFLPVLHEHGEKVVTPDWKGIGESLKSLTSGAARDTMHVSRHFFRGATKMSAAARVAWPENVVNRPEGRRAVRGDRSG